VLNVLDATTRTDQKFAESQLALTKRPPSQIVAIMNQQIECTGHRQTIGGPTVQHVEIGYAFLMRQTTSASMTTLPLMRAVSSTMRG
jgi:hypothetical protein